MTEHVENNASAMNKFCRTLVKVDWSELNYNYQLCIDRFPKMLRADCDLKTIVVVIYYNEEFIPVFSFHL